MSTSIGKVPTRAPPAPEPCRLRPPLRLGPARASCQDDLAGQPYRGFRGLLDHLATLTRDQVRFAGAPATMPMLTEPASAQRDAFEFLGVPDTPTLK
jgi:hypothetical protein